MNTTFLPGESHLKRFRTPYAGSGAPTGRHRPVGRGEGPVGRKPTAGGSDKHGAMATTWTGGGAQMNTPPPLAPRGGFR